MAAQRLCGEIVSVWLSSGFLLRHSASELPGLILVPDFVPVIVIPSWCVGGVYQEALVALAMVQFAVRYFGRECLIAQLRAAGEQWERDHHADTG